MIPGICCPGAASPTGIMLVGYAQATGSGTTLVIDKPANLLTGDILVAFMAETSGTVVTWTGDSGWTERRDQGAKTSLRSATLEAGGSEPASYTFTASTTGIFIGQIIAFRGLQWDAIGTIGTRTDSGVLAIPQVTSAGGVIIGAAANDESNGTYSTPSGMTLVYSGTRMETWMQGVSPGATGTRSTTVTTGDSASVFAGVLIALKPA